MLQVVLLFERSRQNDFKAWWAQRAERGDRVPSLKFITIPTKAVRSRAA